MLTGQFALENSPPTNSPWKIPPGKLSPENSPIDLVPSQIYTVKIVTLFIIEISE